MIRKLPPPSLSLSAFPFVFIFFFPYCLFSVSYPFSFPFLPLLFFDLPTTIQFCWRIWRIALMVIICKWPPFSAVSFFFPPLLSLFFLAFFLFSFTFPFLFFFFFLSFFILSFFSFSPLFLLLSSSPFLWFADDGTILPTDLTNMREWCCAPLTIALNNNNPPPPCGDAPVLRQLISVMINLLAGEESRTFYETGTGTHSATKSIYFS